MANATREASISQLSQGGTDGQESLEVRRMVHRLRNRFNRSGLGLCGFSVQIPDYLVSTALILPLEFELGRFRGPFFGIFDHQR